MNKPWSLTDLYHSFTDEQFLNDVNQSDELIASYATYATTLPNSQNLSTDIADYLLAQQALNRHFEKLFAFCSLSLSANTQNEEATTYMHMLQEKLNTLTEAQTIIQEFLGHLDNYEKLATSQDIIKEHLYFFYDLALFNPYLLSSKEEDLIANLSLTGSSAFTRLRETLTSKKLVDITLDGQAQSVPLSSLRSLLHSEKEDVRQLALQKEIEAYASLEDSLAACLSAIKGEVLTLSNMRGYESVLQETLLSSRLDKNILEAMMATMEDSLPHFQSFLKAKATYLNHGAALPFYEIYAPVGELHQTYTYEEACDVVVNEFSSFSDNLGQFAKTAIESEWIDVYPRVGKVGGAFCQNIHAIGQSRFLLNFAGQFNDVTTLAHELGHGFHGHCLKNVSSLNSQYPMPLAETASIFCETLVKKALIKKASDQERLTLLEAELTDATQLIVDIYARFKFEQSLFEARKNGPLSAKKIKELMLDAQRRAYGDAIVESTLHPYMWANKPHYYYAASNYYNYPYAFGLLFAKGLYARYLEEPETFPSLYEELLKATGDRDIADVAKLAHIDLTNLSFWQHSIQTIIDDIEAFKSLIN